MKEFKKGILIAFLAQLLSWGLFIVIDESKPFFSDAETCALIIGIILLLTYLVFYFKKSKEYITKNKLNSKNFNITLISFWIILSITLAYTFLYLVELDILHVCNSGGWDCFLNGIEYLLYGGCMLILAGIIIVIKIFGAIINYITKDEE